MPIPSTVDRSAVGDGTSPLRDMVARFVADRILPVVSTLDAQADFPAELYRSSQNSWVNLNSSWTSSPWSCSG